ncbi:hypothetical protein RJ641_013616, partial [Dillenia turbinata]
ISGMEQTSFLFQQASKVGFSHSNIHRSIIQRACSRFPSLASFNGLPNTSSTRSKSEQVIKALIKEEGAHKVFVVFGGDTSEWQLEVTPCLLAPSVADLSDENEIQEYPVSSKTGHSCILLFYGTQLSKFLMHALRHLFYLCTVHGGIGEDGTLQSLLESEGVPYTGMIHLGIFLQYYSR